jgi:putative CocE/NonD family hydrolase
MGEDHVPMFKLSGNWSGRRLHLRGNTEPSCAAASKAQEASHPRRHARTSVLHARRARDQLRFFDHWLKGIDNGVMQEPPVKLAIRKGRDEIEWRHEQEWPLARTQWTKFYFDLAQPAPNAGALVSGNPAATVTRSYPATSLGSMGSTSAASSQVMGGGIPPGMGVALETPPLANDVEVTGPVAASFWVSSSSEDMDLFLTLRNIDADGKEVLETGQQGTPVPVAKGWLRVSHRELDPDCRCRIGRITSTRGGFI